MTADEFCAKLAALAPSLEQLLAMGITTKEGEEIRSGYIAIRKSTSSATDPLVDLCANFDFVETEFGAAGIAFCKLTEFDSEHWQVGWSECDPVIIPKSGGVVSIRDHENLRRELVKCATNSAGFLAALLEAQKFLQETMWDLEKRRRGKFRFQVLEKCLELAGGNQYKQFWSGVLGIGPGPAFWQKVWKVLWKDVW